MEAILSLVIKKLKESSWKTLFMVTMCSVLIYAVFYMNPYVFLKSTAKGKRSIDIRKFHEMTYMGKYYPISTTS